MLHNRRGKPRKKDYCTESEQELMCEGRGVWCFLGDCLVIMISCLTISDLDKLLVWCLMLNLDRYDYKVEKFLKGKMKLENILDKCHHKRWTKNVNLWSRQIQNERPFSVLLDSSLPSILYDGVHYLIIRFYSWPRSIDWTRSDLLSVV